MAAAGQVERVARGLYSLPGYCGSEQASLAMVARLSPGVVFCLLTALRFHELTTQAPFQVWIGIGNKYHPPRIAYPPLRVVRLSPAALDEGVERRKVDGVPIRITSVARTVADCFKFRNKVGLDVAIEALRDARRSRNVTSDQIWHYAKLGRVANVMRPYLEAIA